MFFFFKQKTAYEISACLVGSEMCIRDRSSKKPAPSRGAVVSAQADTHKVLLLDGHSLAFRAFFALPDTLVTSSGQVTNAVYGFTAMLIKLLADERPRGIVVCFDKGAPQFRLDRYP